MIVNSRVLICDLAVFWFISVTGRCFKNQIVLIRYCLHFAVHFDTWRWSEISRFMSALRLNVMFIKMKMVSITHVYIYVLKTEVRNESRIFDFYTISLSIIMIRRTVSSIKIETMNHAILTSTNHVVYFTY